MNVIHHSELGTQNRAEIITHQIERFLELKTNNAGAAALQIARERRLFQSGKKTYFKELSKVYGCQCLACGCHEGLVIDHIIPVSLGGCTTWENLQILCKGCNSNKYTKVIDYRPNREFRLTYVPS